MQLAAGLVAIVGLAFWAPRLLPPLEPAPAVAQANVPVAPPSAAAQWFANHPAEVEVSVSGVLDAGRGAVAILSVNGASPQAVRVGEQLARGVRVVAIDAQGLTLERGDSRNHVAVTPLPAAPALVPLTRP
ncbi:type II secretion system protein N [Pseudomonas sp. NPDC089554]|uniref:type II secretion system protein N n=1 Tax=Pseudomonas sp. NPDC089554 TaxID=3390653 RepID=UPI003D06B01E